MAIIGGPSRWFWLALFLLLTAEIQAGLPTSAVATAHPLATRAGIETMRRGGNAFDAAVAVSAALAVVEPSGSGLGGGGFWLLHRASDGKQVMIDGRERAPLAAHRDMFLDEQGSFDQKRSIDGPLSAGIPGMPAAIIHLAEKYGRLSLETSLGPALRLAREGFVIGKSYLKLIGFRYPVMLAYPAAAKIFLVNGKIPGPDFLLVQKDLAHTLEQISERGRDGFYSGPVARAMVRGVRAHGGLWSFSDLEQYRVVEREPIHANYRGTRVTSASPPSSGGVVLSEALNILSGFDLARSDAIGFKHLVIEAMRRAYRDRARYLGDPDFVSMPIERLTSLPYGAALGSGIRIDRSGFTAEMDTGRSEPEREGQDTTHFSIIDAEGNRVAATLSINYPFGSCFVAPGTGVLLNDEMDDFVVHPGSGNVYGLTGGEANMIEPGKRMLSSMTPTFLENPERVAILGTPGGSRIISMILLATLDFEAGKEPDSWVSVPRFHHQYMPDVVEYEKGGLSDDEIQGLQAKGHDVKELNRQYGNMQAILWDKMTNRVTAASDPRREGLSLVE